MGGERERGRRKGTDRQQRPDFLTGERCQQAECRRAQGSEDEGRNTYEVSAHGTHKFTERGE